jgi:glycosyltransferase involved in cell wall biosynthesis
MNVVHINTQSTGGAAKAAINLHLGLLGQGINSKFLYLNGPKPDAPEVYLIEGRFTFWERMAFKLGIKKHYWESVQQVNRYKKDESLPFNLTDTDFDLLKSKQAHYIDEADIIHLHWIAHSIDYKKFFKSARKNIVLTLHDMNPFTGGCHYNFGCGKFTATCNICPQLIEPYNKKFTQKEILNKQEYKNAYTLNVIVLNEWMLGLSQSSSLLKTYNHHIITNSIDTNIFTRAVAKEHNTNRIKIGYVATYHSSLKGSDIFLSLIEHYSKDERIEFHYIGKEYKKDLDQTTYIGNLRSDSELALFYNSIDMLLVPSRGDNFPNVIIEAICCGTPVLASNVGGIPFLINKRNGRLVQTFEMNDWICEIENILSELDSFNHAEIAHESMLLYNKQKQVNEITELYKKLSFKNT